MADEAYEITLAEPHEITDGDQRTLTVSGYEDVGSMFMLELTDGGTRSIGKQLIEDVTPIEEGICIYRLHQFDSVSRSS